MVYVDLTRVCFLRFMLVSFPCPISGTGGTLCWWRLAGRLLADDSLNRSGDDQIARNRLIPLLQLTLSQMHVAWTPSSGVVDLPDHFAGPRNDLATVAEPRLRLVQCGSVGIVFGEVVSAMMVQRERLTLPATPFSRRSVIGVSVRMVVVRGYRNKSAMPAGEPPTLDDSLPLRAHWHRCHEQATETFGDIANFAGAAACRSGLP